MLKTILERMLLKNQRMFSFKNPTELYPNQIYIFDFESLDNKAGKYLPFEIVSLTNQSNSIISVKTELTESIIHPSQTITITNVRCLTVENLSAEIINPNDILIICRGVRK